MIRILAVLVFLSCALPSIAAQARYRGRLVDQDGKPHVNAIVGLAGSRTRDVRLPLHMRKNLSPCFGQEERYQRLLKGEGRTNEKGEFDFLGPDSPKLPYAILQPGYREIFSGELWQATAGQELDLGVVVVERRAIYSFEFTRPDGSLALAYDRETEPARPALLGSIGGRHRACRK